jgi:hypothetical protein
MVAKTVATALCLNRPPAICLIRSTRSYIQEFCRQLASPDTSSRVALAAHELLENLAQHASAGPMRIDVDIVEHDGCDYLRIQTSNRAEPKQLDRLVDVLREVTEAPEAWPMYLRFIARTAEQSEGSGLGLARIRAEADMQIGYAISGDHVTICAETPVSAGSPA